jgi:formamidopyrimidine-DNA glycosylase
MPELPEVETVRRGLNETTLNYKIVKTIVLLDRTIAYPEPVKFSNSIQGCQFKTWHRRGKYLIGEFEQGGHLGVHLRMTGQLLWTRPDAPLEKHTRVRFLMGNDDLRSLVDHRELDHRELDHRELGHQELGHRELRYVDQRTFGQIWWVPPEKTPPEIMHGLQNLGPEPFGDEFSEQYFADWMKGRKRPIKNALLDQSLVAGIGNIYADESLFLSKINPLTHCAVLNPEQLKTLRSHVIEVLKTSIDASGTTLRDYRTVEGTNGNYGAQAWVYGRDGSDCRVCKTTIERIKLAGRSAHFCPKCQPKA